MCPLAKKIKKAGILPKRVENSRLMVYIYTQLMGCKVKFKEAEFWFFKLLQILPKKLIFPFEKGFDKIL
jgi:hypothetical protein